MTQQGWGLGGRGYMNPGNPLSPMSPLHPANPLHPLNQRRNHEGALTTEAKVIRKQEHTVPKAIGYADEAVFLLILTLVALVFLTGTVISDLFSGG